MEKEKKSVKLEGEELTDMIKACVKEALAEQTEEKEDPAADTGEATAIPSEVADLISQAMEAVSEKRRCAKEAGEELGEITADEILEAAAEIAGAVSEEKEDPQADETEEKKGTPNMQKKSNPSPVQRKYSSIYMQRPVTGRGQMKSIPPIIQLARAVKCLDVFGRHDPDAAAYFARRKYDDSEMEREFKALNATNPASGGYLVPERYLDQIVEMLYAKTVIFELGAQKVPMANGNLNIPKMTGGARATWGGEARKIPKSQPTFGNIKMSAKRLEAIVPMTRELMMSTDYSADLIYGNDLTRRMTLGLDYGGMFGRGGEFQPLGVFFDKEVEHIDAKTIGNTDLADSSGKITADFPVFIRSKVLAKNVDDQYLGWTFNSALEGFLMNMKTTTGAYIYREEMNAGKLLGFPYKVSNQIPTDSNGLTELCFGNWADMLVGEQLGLETYTTLDGSWTDDMGIPHNAFEENLAATRALMYADIAARHKESFLHVKNIKVI